MELEGVAKRYIKALTSGASVEAKKEYYEIINGFSKAYRDSKVSQVLNSPLVSTDKKVELVKTVLNDCDETVKQFMVLVAQNNRFDAIESMADVLRLQLQRESNSFEGFVQSAKSITQDDISMLEDALSAKTGTTIKLIHKESDFDGIKVEIPDLGVEVGYSKERMKSKLIDYITKAF